MFHQPLTTAGAKRPATYALRWSAVSLSAAMASFQMGISRKFYGSALFKQAS